jgi:hypothetical protein
MGATGSCLHQPGSCKFLHPAHLCYFTFGTKWFGLTVTPLFLLLEPVSLFFSYLNLWLPNCCTSHILKLILRRCWRHQLLFYTSCCFRFSLLQIYLHLLQCQGMKNCVLSTGLERWQAKTIHIWLENSLLIFLALVRALFLFSVVCHPCLSLFLWFGNGTSYLIS